MRGDEMMRGVPKLNIVVTGGAGFIGSNLCDRLIRQGHRIVCIDNLFTGTYGNIQPLMNHPNFRFIEHDVRDPLKVYGPVDRIYNLACPASPRHYQRDRKSTRLNSSHSSISYAVFCLKKKKKTFLIRYANRLITYLVV